MYYHCHPSAFDYFDSLPFKVQSIAQLKYQYVELRTPIIQMKCLRFIGKSGHPILFSGLKQTMGSSRPHGKQRFKIELCSLHCDNYFNLVKKNRQEAVADA
jgi:hypothetical protein